MHRIEPGFKFGNKDMETQEERERFMGEAIREALKADPGRARPNPRVGAVIVEDGEIVARGHFKEDGGPHAERIALAVLGRPPKEGATLYVTLEPCSTHGRTGACSEAILESGIRRVVAGALDPTPSHRGKGLVALEAKGVSIASGTLVEECKAINPDFQGRET